MKIKRLLTNKIVLMLMVSIGIGLVFLIQTNINKYKKYHSSINSQDKVLGTLKQKLKYEYEKEQLYTSEHCTDYWIEEEEADWLVELKGKYAKECWKGTNTPPAISHLIAQFRVNKKTGEIVWNDIVNDQYVSFNEFLRRNQK